MSSAQILPTQRDSTQSIRSFETQAGLALPLVLLAAGFLIRLVNSIYRFLNPDEALHYLLSVGPSLAVAEKASLTTSHPPLLILFLHYWGMLAHSEWFLRLPHVIAGTAFCWVMFCWLRRVTNYATALMTLVLLLFSPTLIQLSAEVRQYAFLLLFSAGSLYLLDSGIEDDSPRRIFCSAVLLYLALLVHYAGLIFALTLGLYALVRLITARVRMATVSTWVAGQIGALAIIAFLFVHHVSKLRARGQPEQVAETYARRSIFWPGEEHAWSFVGRNTVRLFHYFFSQGAVGVLALIIFVWGLVLLFRQRDAVTSRRPSTRLLALLFVFPLAVNCITALLRFYPYGGSRHDCYLAIFMMPAIAVALARWNPAWMWWKPLSLGAVLAVCNFFPAPLAEYIRFHDQNRKLMTRAVADLRALPAGSTIFTDDQGGLMLSYYLCDKRVVQIEQLPPQPFMRESCGPLSVISFDPRLWIFRAETFPDTMQRMQQTYHLPSGTPLWLFQSGWYVDREGDLKEELKQYGCSVPQNFGRNMYVCRIVATGGT